MQCLKSTEMVSMEIESETGVQCEKAECVAVDNLYKRYRFDYTELERDYNKLKKEIKDQTDNNKELVEKTVLLQQEIIRLNSIISGESDCDDDTGRSWFRKCEGCSKLKKIVKKLQDVIEDKDTKLQSFTTKVNTDFGYHQGNSIEDSDVKQLWIELFLYEAENDIPQCYTYSQKIEIRQLFCSMFMEMYESIQKEIIKRMADCLRTVFTEKLDSETDQNILEAFSILQKLDHIQIPTPILVEGSVQTDSDNLIERMADFLRSIFTPELLNPENSKMNQKEIQRAFSHLVTNPKVKEKKFKLSHRMQRTFQKNMDSYKLTNMNKFVQTALSLCERMSTRVPPYIISVREKKFDPELHELKFVKGGPTPELLQEHPEVPVIYLRPIVYYNYQGKVYIPGSVVSSYTPRDTTGTAGSSDSTNPQQPTADGESETDSAEYLSSSEN